MMVILVSLEFAQRNLLSSWYSELLKASIVSCFEGNSIMAPNFQHFPSTVSASISLAKEEMIFAAKQLKEASDQIKKLPDRNFDSYDISFASLLKLKENNLNDVDERLMDQELN